MSEQLLPQKRTSAQPATTTRSPSKKNKPISPTHDVTFFNDEEDDESATLLSTLLDFSSPPKTTPFPPFKVRFVPSPYLPSSPFECSTSYVTINGNEETCGSSFADVEASVMASVDTGGPHKENAGEVLCGGNRNYYNNDVVFGSSELKSREGEEGWDWGELFREEEEQEQAEKKDNS